MPNAERMRRGRQELPRNNKIRAGEKLTLSAAGKGSSAQYLDDIDTSMPEKLRAKKSAPFSPMKSVKSAYHERQPQGVWGISMDTGEVEVGYDSKKQHTVVSFVHRTNTQRAKEVSEEGAATEPMKNNIKLDSNDRYFYGGAVAMRVDAQNSSKKVFYQLSEASQIHSGQSTMDRVLPFLNDNQEQSRLKILAQSAHSRTQNRTEVGTASTALHLLINTKKQRKLQFFQKLSKAVGAVKEVQSHDDTYFLLKKKRQEILQAIAQEEEISLPNEEEKGEETKL